MFCCGKERNGKYCAECGSPLVADTVKRNLAEYLDRQARTVRCNLETRKQIKKDISDSAIAKMEEKINRWIEWREWVLSAEQET